MMKLATIIKRMEKLAENWDDSIEIFGNNGSLQIVSLKDYEILAHVDGISCDGGDCNIIVRDGKEYLDLE